MRNTFHPTARNGAHRLIDDRRGTAAIEFAFIFPVMLTLFFGSFEITNLLMLNLKLTAATEAASDLLAQTRSNQNNVAPSDLNNYWSAATMEMSPYAGQPYTTVGLKLAFASITFNAQTGAAQVLWHNEQNGATAINTASLPQSVLMPLNNGSGTDSLIMAQSQITYSSPLSWVLGKTYTFTDTAYNRPRYVLQITCTTC
jgi:Flp pilus assembly protein TadG